MNHTVLIVLPSFRMGGAEQVTIRLANGLAATGSQVILVVLDPNGPLRTAVTSDVRILDLRRRRALQALPLLVRTVRSRRPDVILSSHTHVSVLLVLARALLGRRSRIVVREPGRWSDGLPEKRTVRLLRRFAYRRADLVLATSETMRSELQGECRRPVALLHNPVDVAGLRASAAVPVRIPGPGRRFLHVGRLAHGKAVPELLSTFAACAAPDDHLTIVGDGPLRAQVEDAIRSHRLEDRVTLTGLVLEPGPLLAGGDALVLASRSEGMPNAVLEALAVGTPVIATTDLVTLQELALEAPEGALSLVPRAQLGDAMAALVPPGTGTGARPSLLPEDRSTELVVARLRRLIAAPGEEQHRRIVVPMLSPYPSVLAPTVQVANMAQAFVDLGHEVTVIAPTPDPELAHVAPSGATSELYGFTPGFGTFVLSRRTRRGQSLTNSVRIARIVRRSRADLLFSRDLRSCLIPALRGVPTVFEVHSLSPLDGHLDRALVRWLIRIPAFRGFVAISAALSEDMTARAGIPENLIHVAHDAARPQETPGPRSTRVDRERIDVGYTGSLFAGRGVEMLVEVAARAPWLTLHLIGGPEPAVRAYSERLARRPDLTNVNLHGLVSPAESQRRQREFDVLVAPFAHKVDTDSGVDTSRWMSPMKVFEYMASGRPIVISDLPVLREVLRPDVDALMVPPEDPDALLAALERLRDDPELGARLAASALERVRTEFTWELRARRILERFVPEAPLREGADATGVPERP